MKPIKTLIVDDEALARVNIRQALETYTHWQVVGELHNGKDLLTLVKKTAPQVIFLDVQMPGRNGLILAEELLALPAPPIIVFVTAYDEYAVNAFELCAFDYLLKPFDDERFSQTINRLEGQLNNNNPSTQQLKLQQLNSADTLDRLIIRSIGSIKFVNINEVYWFKSCGNYAEVYHQGGMDLHRVSLSFLETKLDPQEFCRVHRSAVVRINQIKEMNTADDNSYHLSLFNGDEVKVSPAYKNRLFERLGL